LGVDLLISCHAGLARLPPTFIFQRAGEYFTSLHMPAAFITPASVSLPADQAEDRSSKAVPHPLLSLLKSPTQKPTTTVAKSRRKARGSDRFRRAKQARERERPARALCIAAMSVAQS
jgi:hypothetical protein